VNLTSHLLAPHIKSYATVHVFIGLANKKGYYISTVAFYGIL